MKNGVSIVFVLFIMLLALLGIILKDKATSTQENRPLQQAPTLSLASISSGRYQQEIESYVSDQFPARAAWVNMRTNFEYALGKQEFNNVFIGKEHELYQERVVPSKDMMKQKIDAVNTFTNAYENMNVSMLLIPNKTTILYHRLPSSIQQQDQTSTLQTFQKGLVERVKFVDTCATLNDHRNEYIYYRSDHHWTSRGAYIAFETWKSAVLPQEPLLAYEHYKVNDSFYGTLANTSAYMRGEPDSIEIYTSQQDPQYYVQYASKKKTSTSLFDKAKLKTNNPYEVFLSGNEALIDIHTTVENTKHLLVLKDSYANEFISFLLPYYSTITIVDPRYYYEDLQTLIRDRSITDTLLIYNANTFFADTSLQSVVSTLGEQ